MRCALPVATDRATGGQQVGLDGGRTTVAARSTGEALAQARFFRQAQQARATAPRRLRPAARGPPERAARRTVVARVDARSRWRRGDFAQHHSRRLADAVALSAVADVSVKRMGQTQCLAQRLQDAAWSQLADLLASQAARAGRKYAAVTPASPSQHGSPCGDRPHPPRAARPDPWPT